MPVERQNNSQEVLQVAVQLITGSYRVSSRTGESTCSDCLFFLSQGKEELEVEFTMESR